MRVKKILLLLLYLLTIGITLVTPIMLFLSNPYYDRSGVWLKVRNKTSTFMPQVAMREIRQEFVSPSDNLARLTLRGQGLSGTVVEMALRENETTLRHASVTVSAPSPIVWEFPPIADSINKPYALTITIPEIAKETTRFGFYPAAYNGMTWVDGALVTNAALTFYTESKFPNIRVKLATLSERMRVFKPRFIQILIVPAFVLYLFAFNIALWYSLKSILREK